MDNENNHELLWMERSAGEPPINDQPVEPPTTAQSQSQYQSQSPNLILEQLSKLLEIQNSLQLEIREIRQLLLQNKSAEVFLPNTSSVPRVLTMPSPAPVAAESADSADPVNQVSVAITQALDGGQLRLPSHIGPAVSKATAVSNKVSAIDKLQRGLPRSNMSVASLNMRSNQRRTSVTSSSNFNGNATERFSNAMNRRRGLPVVSKPDTTDESTITRHKKTAAATLNDVLRGIYNKWTQAADGIGAGAAASSLKRLVQKIYLISHSKEKNYLDQHLALWGEDLAFNVLPSSQSIAREEHQDMWYHQIACAVAHAKLNQYEHILILGANTVPHRELVSDLECHLERQSLVDNWDVLFMGWDDRRPLLKIDCRDFEADYYHRTNPDLENPTMDHWRTKGFNEGRTGDRSIYQPNEGPLTSFYAVGLSKAAYEYLFDHLPTNSPLIDHEKVFGNMQDKFVEHLYMTLPPMFVKPITFANQPTEKQIREAYLHIHVNCYAYHFNWLFDSEA